MLWWKYFGFCLALQLLTIEICRSVIDHHDAQESEVQRSDWIDHDSVMACLHNPCVMLLHRLDEPLWIVKKLYS